VSIDFPRAWELAAATDLPQHHPQCSYRQTERALLCDCDVLYKHPEMLDEAMHTRGGRILSVITSPLAASP
jgi:hypothetical protein